MQHEMLPVGVCLREYDTLPAGSGPVEFNAQKQKWRASRYLSVLLTSLDASTDMVTSRNKRLPKWLCRIGKGPPTGLVRSRMDMFETGFPN